MRICGTGLIARLRSILKSIARPLLKPAPDGEKAETGARAVEDYWTEHNVTLHRKFNSAKESLEDFHWRNDQYFGYLDLMPVSGVDGLAVLDFGCGPGYDLVGFATHSKPSRLVGIDVSESSLAEASDRLALHSSDVELLRHDVSDGSLPLDDASMDLVHSSGVLHHVPDIDRALAELRRVLKHGGTAQFMVYHADSLWVHLYVAYERQIVQGIDTTLTLAEAFQRSTDGPGCPISRCYTHAQFVELAARHGFALETFGVAVSAWEMSLLHKRFAAIMDQRLFPESRSFLAALTFDDKQLPLVRPGVHAGIDGCYRFRAV